MKINNKLNEDFFENISFVQGCLFGKIQVHTPLFDLRIIKQLVALSLFCILSIYLIGK